MKDLNWINRQSPCLADCPCRELAVGKYKGRSLETTPISYQKWVQSLGYPESMFVDHAYKMVQENEDAYFDTFCRDNNI